MPRRLEQWRALPLGEQIRLAQLAALMPMIAGVVRVAGVRRTYRAMGRMRRDVRVKTHVGDADRAHAERLGRLIDIASRHGTTKATCLPQSLALWWLLRRRGLPAELRIGVAKPDGRMSAHAWVELDGRAVNDHADVAERYAPYPGL